LVLALSFKLLPPILTVSLARLATSILLAALACILGKSFKNPTVVVIYLNG
jgi:hypothetical protein